MGDIRDFPTKDKAPSQEQLAQVLHRAIDDMLESGCENILIVGANPETPTLPARALMCGHQEVPTLLLGLKITETQLINGALSEVLNG